MHFATPEWMRTFVFPEDLRRLNSPALGSQDIHVWTGHPQPRQKVDAGLLSTDEIARMNRFHFERDRNDFLFARAMLRTVLGTYLEVPLTDIRFAYSKHGKPSLADPSPARNLQFNLSHTSSAVLVAVCLDRPIGSDIERVREDFNVEEIAARFFSKSEQRALLDLPPGERCEAFFRCWTRKEALIKARGDGLSFPLDQFDVSIGLGEDKVELAMRTDPDEADRWRILAMPAPTGYAAAVAFGTRIADDREA